MVSWGSSIWVAVEGMVTGFEGFFSDTTKILKNLWKEACFFIEIRPSIYTALYIREIRKEIKQKAVHRNSQLIWYNSLILFDNWSSTVKSLNFIWQLIFKIFLMLILLLMCCVRIFLYLGYFPYEEQYATYF